MISFFFLREEIVCWSRLLILNCVGLDLLCLYPVPTDFVIYIFFAKSVPSDIVISFVHLLFFFRSLYLSSVAEKRGRSIHVSDLEELLNGCTELEVRFSLLEMIH